MTYARVIPRDLFNEANLLKCLGQLSVALGAPENYGHDASLTFVGGVGDWYIEQNPADGSISAAMIVFKVRDYSVRLYRPLNSRQPWPLWVAASEIFPPLPGATLEDFEVFDDEGRLSPDFRQFIGLSRGD